MTTCASLALLLALPLAFVQSKPSTPASAPPVAQAWVVCTGDSTQLSGRLGHIDVASGAVERVVPIAGNDVEHQPLEVTLLPDGLTALVPQLYGAGTQSQWTRVQTVSLADGSVQADQRFEGWLDGLELHPVTGELWGLHIDRNGFRHLVKVNLRKHELIEVGRLPDELAPRSLAFSRNGRELWCLSATNMAASDELVRLDPDNGNVLRRTPWTIEQPAHALEIDAAGRALAFAWGGTLYEVDLRSGRAKQLCTLADPQLGIVTGFDLERAPVTAAPRR